MSRGNSIDRKSVGQVGWIQRVRKERKTKKEDEVESHKMSYIK